jgi:hypothetical protein
MKPVFALTIDDTTAHVLVAADEAGEMLAWFQRRGIECQLRRRAGAGGLDLLDFGNPAPDREVAIRQAFAAWPGRRP